MGSIVLEQPDRVFSKAVEKELANFPGMWVAVRGDEILGVSHSLGKLVGDLGADLDEDVLLHSVPAKPNTAYFF